MKLRGCDLYMLGIFDEQGELEGFVRAGRPPTYRVYKSLESCKRGIRQHHYDVMKPVKITGMEVVE